MESLRTVEPGGHHLGTPHTVRHFRTAFYRADLFDTRPYEQWEQEGGEDAYERAHEKVKQLLKEYEAPPLDEATDEALLDFMERRKAELDGG